LRSEILRLPFGLVLTLSDTEDDNNQYHFGVVEMDQLIATVSFKPTNSGEAVLRQMAVKPEYHGKGVGFQLVQFAEHALLNQSIRSIRLAARTSAQGFYAKLGYQVVDTPYVHLGIEHIDMVKSIS
jgi:hypothetical protein